MDLEGLVDRHESEELRTHLEDHDLLMRLIAGASLLYRGDEDLGPKLLLEYIDSVIATIHDKDPLSRRFSNETGENLNQVLILPLGQHKPGSFSSLVPFFWESWLESPQYYECVHAAIALTFEHSSVVPPVPPDYRKNFEHLVQSNTIWECDGDLPGLLKSRGLPFEQSEMAVWLESAATL